MNDWFISMKSLKRDAYEMKAKKKIREGAD